MSSLLNLDMDGLPGAFHANSTPEHRFSWGSRESHTSGDQVPIPTATPRDCVVLRPCLSEYLDKRLGSDKGGWYSVRAWRHESSQRADLDISGRTHPD
jgi:hypothetical protein